MTFESPGIDDVTTLSDVPTFAGRRLLTPDEVATDRTRESVNIVSGDVPEVERLKEAMESWSKGEVTAQESVTDEKRDELANLGYL